MYKKITLVAFAAGALMLAAFYMPSKINSKENGDNELTAKEKKEGWKLLFDGKTTDSWRTYKNLPDDSWKVINGELYCKLDSEGVTKRSDLITKDQYTSFEMQLDWKVAREANSGVLYHVVETHDGTYETGPEYQLIDDAISDLEPWQKSGADYAMHPPLKLAAKPVGEYNHTKIVVNGSHVEHWLNGEKVADFYAWTPEWQKLKATGKWKDYPDYGNAKSGFIALQDHGGGIWFKNIKIRKL
jgi:3-keto-disaccharide hydrolase